MLLTLHVHLGQHVHALFWGLCLTKTNLHHLHRRAAAFYHQQHPKGKMHGQVEPHCDSSHRHHADVLPLRCDRGGQTCENLRALAWTLHLIERHVQHLHRRAAASYHQGHPQGTMHGLV
jgi:hypothetical protein